VVAVPEDRWTTLPLGGVVKIQGTRAECAAHIALSSVYPIGLLFDSVGNSCC
jgi:hypothetical protein